MKKNNLISKVLFVFVGLIGLAGTLYSSDKALFSDGQEIVFCKRITRENFGFHKDSLSLEEQAKMVKFFSEAKRAPNPDAIDLDKIRIFFPIFMRQFPGDFKKLTKNDKKIFFEEIFGLFFCGIRIDNNNYHAKQFDNVRTGGFISFNEEGISEAIDAVASIEADSYKNEIVHFMRIKEKLKSLILLNEPEAMVKFFVAGHSDDYLSVINKIKKYYNSFPQEKKDTVFGKALNALLGLAMSFLLGKSDYGVGFYFKRDLLKGITDNQVYQDCAVMNNAILYIHNSIDFLMLYPESPSYKEYIEVLKQFYRSFYMFAVTNGIIPSLKFSDGDIFEFPSEWGNSLINVQLRNLENLKKQEDEKLFLQKIAAEKEKLLLNKKIKDLKEKEEADARAAEFLKELEGKQSCSGKKRAKKKGAVKALEACSADQDVPQEQAMELMSEIKPFQPITISTIKSASFTKIQYATRIQDWFENPEKALTLQGYQGDQAIPFKRKLLAMFGEEVIVFNHKFPKVIDPFLLDNQSIVPQKKDDQSFLISVLGYYVNENQVRNFGFFEIAFMHDTSDVLSAGKKINNYHVFHRFFRPVQKLSELYLPEANSLMIDGIHLDSLELQAVQLEDESWTTPLEEESWQVNTAKEDQKLIIVTSDKKSFYYGLILP